MKNEFKKKCINVISFILAIIYAFPILYMVLTSFKSEANVVPPALIFNPTLQNYKDVISSSMLLYLSNSIICTTVALVISIILALPASYAIVFGNLKRANGIYFWFVCTTLLPAVSVIMPIYLIFTRLGLVDTKFGLILLYIGVGVPLIIWMTTTFFKEIPVEIIEASYLDGSSKLNTFFKIMLPLMRSGIISAVLLVFVIVWNDFFFAVSVTYTRAPTLPVFMGMFMTQQGFFWAKMCAASTLVVIFPVTIGLLTQKAFIKGMIMGAVKE